MGIIGINVPFMGDGRKAQIEEMAGKHGFTVRYYTDESLRQQKAGDCEIFFGMMPAGMLKDCSSLRWFQCSFAGVDRYCDDALFPGQPVILTNASGAYGTTISEHMLCTLLMMMRRMPEYTEITRNRQWRQVGDVRSIFGSTVTVIGMGDIGTSFARRLKAMGATVRGVRRNGSKPAPDCYDEVYTTDKLDDALRGADVAALCLPDTGETRSLMDERRFMLLSKGAYVLNVGRGSAIDQPGLIRCLESGHLAGAALDVTVPEPLPSTDPLWDAPNILITPHVSGNMSLEYTCEIIWSIFINNFQLYVQGKPLTNVIDRKLGY